MAFEDLLAYKKAFENGIAIFEWSKSFPQKEKYSLTDQIRRSSRSVNATIAEASRKRRYPKHSISKLTAADGENSETAVWLNYSLACSYMTENQHQPLWHKTIEVGTLINYMINHPGKFGVQMD
jgi:four helix bundle protein